MNIPVDNISIEVVDEAEHLQIVVERLQMRKELVMDTEFDSFNKQ